MLWIGERTRQLDGAHVEFLRGVGNPLGCKLGPTATPDEVARAVRGAEPRPGRPAASRSISRMGADAVEDALPPAPARGRATPATRWCGPATPCTATRSRRRAGRKTRHFDDIFAEIAGFFARTAPRAPGPAASTWS